MAACVALAWLPDADVLWLSLGVPDRGIFGHRGFTHTPVFALGVGLVVALVLWARRKPEFVRLGLFAASLVLSHSILDASAQDGRGMLFFWPLSAERFHLPWRPIPDAPVGLAMFSRVGLSHLAIEFGMFLPFTFFALRRRARDATRAPAPATLRLPARPAPSGG
jgi:inner membrane protein